MNKTLKFAPHLVPLILSGEKTSTWRLWDDKQLAEGDLLDFYNSSTGEKVVTTIAIRVLVKKFSELSKEDKIGHEPFESDEAMYKSFEACYKKPVGPETIVKIIWFEAIN